MSKEELLINTKDCEVESYTGLYLSLQGEGSWDAVLVEVTGYINKRILEEGLWGSTLPNSIYYTIVMPCGEHMEFKTEQDVMNLEPEKDIPCTCGDPTHYFVRWNKMPADS